MRFFRKIKQIVRGRNKRAVEPDYYEQLFVHNTYWNTPQPNDEEILRFKIIHHFIAHLKSDFSLKKKDHLKILDLGSGRGWLSSLLSNYGTVLGVEPVSKVVDHAKKMFPNLNFICGTSTDLLKIAHHDKYDLVVSSEVIEHIVDEAKPGFMNDIKRLLNDHGFLIITTPRKEAEIEWNTYTLPGQPVEDWITEMELEKLAIANSFRVIKRERLAIPPAIGAPSIEIYQLWLFQKI